MKYLVALIMLLSPVFLYAEKEPIDLYSLSLRELAEIKVTGSTLTAEPLSTVPSSVTVFSSKQIKRLAVDTLDELMHLVPGFQSYRTANSSLSYQLSSRGRRIGTSSSEVLVLIDGERLDEPRSSGIAYVIPKYPLTNIERVEFIRGPGSAVYGSNAMTGLINMISKKGINELSVGVGSQDRHRLALQLSEELGDTDVDLFLHFDRDNGDNYRVLDSYSSDRIDTDDPRQLTDLNLKAQWHNTKFNIQHHEYSSENYYEADALANGITYREGQVSSLSLQQKFDWQQVSSNIHLSYRQAKLTIALQASAPGAFSAISSPQSDAPLTAVSRLGDSTEFLARWHSELATNNDGRWHLGVEYRHIDSPVSSAAINYDFSALLTEDFPIDYFAQDTQDYISQLKSSRDILGIFQQYQRRLFTDTHLTLGLRYDDFSNIGSQLSPRLGLVQVLNSRQSVKLLYGEAFRAPAEFELYLTNNPLIRGNTQLKPESVNTWELIWTGQWSSTNLTLGYFQNRYKDSIIQADAAGGVLQYTNADQQPSRGYEVELSHEFNEHWLMRASYTQLQEKPELAFLDTDQFASLMINFQRNRINANLQAIYHADRQMATGGSINNRITLEDNTVLSAKISYQLSPSLQVFSQAKNLLDTHYLGPGVTTKLKEGVPNRGRELLLGIRWQY